MAHPYGERETVWRNARDQNRHVKKSYLCVEKMSQKTYAYEKRPMHTKRDQFEIDQRGEMDW